MGATARCAATARRARDWVGIHCSLGSLHAVLHTWPECGACRTPRVQGIKNVPKRLRVVIQRKRNEDDEDSVSTGPPATAHAHAPAPPLSLDVLHGGAC